MQVYNYILRTLEKKKAIFSILVDPDEVSLEDIPYFVQRCCLSGVDLLLVGGSLIMDTEFNQKIKAIKLAAEKIPVVVFPGGLTQISAEADAMLFISLLSGRNSDYIIGNQVIAAPIIKKLNLETISTAYLLIDSGQKTSVEFMSGTTPIPSHKPDIAVAHAMAAELIGFRLVYLEAGSGAQHSVPEDLIMRVRQAINLPIIVGGGIKSPQEANRKVEAGASIVVVGNHFQKDNNSVLIEEFANAIH